MGTDPGVRGGGRVRGVVVWGKQGGGDSFHACYMKAVHGLVVWDGRWVVQSSNDGEEHAFTARTPVNCATTGDGVGVGAFNG